MNERAEADPEPLKAAGVIVIAPGGEVLFLRNKQRGTWEFPGGGIENSETTENAAAREFLEETGFRLGSVGSEFMRRIRDGVDYTTFARRVDGIFVPKLSGEHDAFMWIKPGDALEEIASAAPISATAA